MVFQICDIDINTNYNKHLAIRPAPHGLNLNLALIHKENLMYLTSNKSKSCLKVELLREWKFLKEEGVLAVFISVLKDEFRKVCLPLNCDSWNYSLAQGVIILVWIACSLFWSTESLKWCHWSLSVFISLTAYKEWK